MKFLLFFCLAVTAAAAPLHPAPKINSKGLYSLTFSETGTREWVPNFGTGSPGGEFFAFCDYNGNHYNKPTSSTLSGSKLSQVYAWGSCEVTFTVLADQTLEISGIATNKTAGDLPNFELDFCKIAPPTTAPGLPPTVNCRYDPGYWSYNGSSADVPCWLAFSDAEGWQGTMNAGQANWGANAYYAKGYMLKAGESASFKFDLNFVSTAEELGTVQSKANSAYAAKYPQTHYVSDLRSIGQIFFVTGQGASGWAADHAKWATNPRGWLGDPTIDISNKPAFKSRMEAFCRQCVANADTVPNLRGFLIWDIEGEMYQHGTGVYVGHPSLLPKWAPELDEIADDLIGILEDGGKYEVGFCLRQQQYIERLQNTESPFYFQAWAQPDGDASRQDLEHEIEYCLGRWGDKASLYYIDSNEGSEVNNYQALSNEFPTLLIYPESFTVVTGMYPYEPQYQTGRAQDYVRNGLSTQSKYTAVYPHAQSVINLADVPNNQANVDAVTAAMMRGDIQQLRIWWTGGSEYPLLKAATTQAQAKGWPNVGPAPSPTPSPIPSPTPQGNYSNWLNSLSEWIRANPAHPNP